MDCVRAQELCYLLPDGQLESSSVLELEAHLRVCPTCAEKARSAAKVVQVVRQRLRRAQAPDRLRRRLRAAEDFEVAVGQR